MSLALYIDVQVRRAITSGLRLRGVDVLTAQEDGAAELSDPELLDRAGSLGRVFFTRDQDFLGEAARRQRTGDSFATVIYAHQLHVTIGQCIDNLESLANALHPSEAVNQVIYLPLR